MMTECQKFQLILSECLHGESLKQQRLSKGFDGLNVYCKLALISGEFNSDDVYCYLKNDRGALEGFTKGITGNPLIFSAVDYFKSKGIKVVGDCIKNKEVKCNKKINPEHLHGFYFQKLEETTSSQDYLI